ncbi:MAG TPA: hypothetical protein VGD91_18905 [Trebonia sp.]
MSELEPTRAESADISPLFQPFKVRGLTLRNRFVMPGMQRYWCADGAPDQRLRDSYRRRAAGGAACGLSGLIDASTPVRGPAT